MTTQPADLALLAGKLTARQREALIARQGSLSVCRALRRKGLAERIEGTGMAWCAYPELSNLGYALKSHLQENSNG